MSDPADPVVVRELSPGDLNYVFSTWLRDLREADASPLPSDLWFPAHRALLERVLADPGVTAVVAAASDRPDEILGYAAAEPGEVLWWVHVRRELRGRGLARRLLEAVNAPEGTPAAWTTPAARDRLRNPCRSRRIRARRKHADQPLTASP